MKTRIARDVATARRPGRPISAAMGTAGVTQAEADRARIRTVLRAPSDWRASATTSVPASTTEHGAAGAPIAAPADIVRTGDHAPAPGPRLPGPIERKLKVGAINDPLEHEADRVADQVMRMPAPEAAPAFARVQLGRKSEKEKVQKKSTALDVGDGRAPESVSKALRSPGQPLDTSSRGYFEPRFGHDFSRVRVHSDAGAAQ